MRIIPKFLSDTWYGNVILGVLSAVIFYYVILTTVLSSDTPVVSVVSSSMEHSKPETTHYQWLGDHLGYNRSYIDSWPVNEGLAIGDMPVIRGHSSPAKSMLLKIIPFNEKNDTYKAGDVIVYSVPGITVPIIHRIIKANDDGTYQTKGDNNMNQLPYEFSVSMDQIKGKVIFIIPKIGYFKVLINGVVGV